MFPKDTFNISEGSLDGFDQQRDNRNKAEVILQIQEIPTYAKYLRLYNFFGIIFSILISVFGVLLKVKSLNLIGITLIVLGIVLIVAFLFGNYAVNSYEEAARNESNLENIDQSWERTLVNFFIYILLLFFFVFLVFTIVCVFYKQDIASFIDQLSYNQKMWTEVFGNVTYQDVSSKAKLVIQFTGYLCALFCLYLACGLFLVFNMLDVYRSFQAVVQFVCIIFFAIGMCLLYVAQYAYRFIDIIDSEKNMGDWVPNALFIVSIVTILISVIGFIAHYAENKSYLSIFGGISVIFTIAILVFSIFAFNYSGNVKNAFVSKCNNLIDLVEEKFLIDYMGCANKYSQKNNNIDKLTCGKNEILYIWETNYKKEVEQHSEDQWGCINEECCAITYNTITKSTNILCVIALVLFISGLVMSVGTIYVYTQLASGIERPPGAKSNTEKVSIVIFVLLIVVIVLAMSSSLPKKPTTDDSRYDEITPSNNSNAAISPVSVDRVNVTVEANAEKKNITSDINKSSKIEEKNDCKATGCPVIKYFYELSSKEGKFIRNATFNYAAKNITITEENLVFNSTVPYYVKFNGNVANLNGYTEYFIYEHNCPLLPAKINVKINAKAFAPDQPKTLRNLAFLDNEELENNENENKLNLVINGNNKLFRLMQQNPNTNTASNNTTIEIKPILVDVSNMKVNDTKEILNKEFDFSFVSNSTQTVIGTVKEVLSLSQNKPLNNTKITIQNLDFAQCQSQILATDEKGQFFLNPLFVFNDDIKTEYLIKIEAASEKNLTNLQTKFVVGGFGFSKVIDFGEILMWSQKMSEKVQFRGQTLDALSNKPLEGVKVSLFQGYLSENNDLLSPAMTPPTNSEDNKMLTQAQSNTEGYYQFSDLGPGRYTFVLEKEKHYIEYFCK